MRRIEPGEGQESVWDYPRPPILEPVSKHIKVVFNGVVLAETDRAIRYLETSHPPNYYIPPEDVNHDCLSASGRTTTCEWKGTAHYLSVHCGDRVEKNAAWFYPEPHPEYSAIAGYIAFYPQQMDECTVDGEVVRAQAGSFYGGWITSDLVGPFKGPNGTGGW